MFQEAWSNLTEMGFLNVVLFLQVTNKSHLKSVDALNVSKNYFQLVIIKHVHPLSALLQVALQRKGILKNLKDFNYCKRKKILQSI